MKLVTLILSQISGAWQGRFVLESCAEAARARWTSSDWARVRAPVRHRDLALSEKATQWLSRLPANIQPTELCQRFPRIVNRIATLWKDEGLTEYNFIELLADMRGGRQGFPPKVVNELMALYERHLMRADARPSEVDTWQVATQV